MISLLFIGKNTAIFQCKYLRRNYLRLCEIGEQYRILPLLRAVEQYLMDSRIHPMRKLELSVELRMAMLYDRGLREMGAPHIALRKVGIT